MQVDANDLLGLIDIALGAAKDKAFRDALLQVQTAQRKYLIAEAESRRTKVRELVYSIHDIDVATIKFEAIYHKLRPTLSDEAQEPFRKVYENLKQQRIHLVKEKHSVNGRTGS